MDKLLQLFLTATINQNCFGQFPSRRCHISLYIWHFCIVLNSKIQCYSFLQSLNFLYPLSLLCFKKTQSAVSFILGRIGRNVSIQVHLFHLPQIHVNWLLRLLQSNSFSTQNPKLSILIPTNPNSFHLFFKQTAIGIRQTKSIRFYKLLDSQSSLSSRQSLRR